MTYTLMSLNRFTKNLRYPAFFLWLIFIQGAMAQIGRWTSFPDTAKVIPREECGFAQAGGKFYLFGGRGAISVQEYDPSTKIWKDLKRTPDTLNHFQALSHSGLIYVLGTFSQGSGYPKEPPSPYVHIYDPLSDTWVKGITIPKERQRGSAGLVEYKNKFYVALGNSLGHTGPGVVFLDEFDPSTNTWTPLADAPRTRDHFQAAVGNGKLYAMGGRQSINSAASYTNLEKVDVYDFATGIWSTLPSPDLDMKVKRSGGIVATIGDEIIYAGGSNPAVFPSGAYNLVDGFNTTTNTWRSLAPMIRGRQVTGGFVNNSALYVASGSGGTGGSPTLRSMEAFYLKDSLPVTGDPLVAGKLAPKDSAFNFGIISSGQESRQIFSLLHTSGNQGVLISGLKIVGDAAFQIKTVVVAPYLVRPTEQSLVNLSFTSKGTVPTETYLEITLAVPPGAIVRVPLDANRKATGTLNHTQQKMRITPVGFWDGKWLHRQTSKKSGNLNSGVPIFRNALGKTDYSAEGP
jgi:large repetitive protein